MCPIIATTTVQPLRLYTWCEHDKQMPIVRQSRKVDALYRTCKHDRAILKFSLFFIRCRTVLGGFAKFNQGVQFDVQLPRTPICIHGAGVRTSCSDQFHMSCCYNSHDTKQNSDREPPPRFALGTQVL